MKKFIGRCLLNACEHLPAAKPFLRKWGLRTSKEWFGNRVVRVQLSAGRSFKLASLSQNYLSFELFWRGAGYYEPVTGLLARELAQPGDTVLDVGANIGFYSLSLVTAQPRVRVIAFEPNPKNFALLKGNVAANHFSQITCEPLALSDAAGAALLYLSGSDMSASLQSDFDDHPMATVEIDTATLDSYLASRAIDGRLLIKVDVEGHETAFLQGARETIASRKPDMIVEITFTHPAETVLFLKDAGYRFYQITDQGLVESELLTPVIRDRLVFLNYLISTKSRAETAALSRRIANQVQAIDWTQTSKYVDENMILKLRARQILPPRELLERA